MLTYIIRPAIAADTEGVLEISKTTFIEAFADQNREADMAKYIAENFSLEKTAAEFAEQGSTFFVAEHEGQFLGYLKLRTLKTPADLTAKRPIEIERIYVQQKSISQKIGAALMQTALDFATKNEFDTIWLGVWEHNQRAISFYQKWGFSQFSSHLFVLGDDAQTDFLMKKSL